MLAIAAALAGCGGGSGGGVTTKTYGGADPKGDYIAVTIDSSAGTLTYHNYTTDEHYGPYAFSRITDPARNFGFQNLYATGVIPAYPTPNCYAEFVLMDGVALILQMFDQGATPDIYDDDTPDGNPIFAYYRRAVDMTDYRGQVFNWVGYEMGADAGNFEVGCAAFDTNATDPAGRLYGGGYNRRAEVEYPGWAGYNDRGMRDINDTGLGTSSFTYDADLVANTAGSLTLIGTDSGDFILDRGPGAGAGFALRQAAAKEWQTAYNGTYFAFIYKNNAGAQEVSPMKVVLSGGGFAAYEPISAASPSLTGSFTDIETFPEGPCPPGGDPMTFAAQLQAISGCNGAEAAAVRNAYRCRGGFVATVDDRVVYLMLDPAGRYLCFASFEEGTNHYAFGFGIKDPEY